MSTPPASSGPSASTTQTGPASTGPAPTGTAPAGTQDKLRHLLDRYASRSDTGPISFALSSPRRGWLWRYESESRPKPYFTASITKLYTAAVIMQLRAEGRVELEVPVAAYLGGDILNGLHVLKGVDHSSRVTVRDLLAHTSGIAGYFDEKRRGGGTLVADVIARDRAWSIADALQSAAGDMKPHFVPGAAKKAFYSDTNYHLLGLLTEQLTGNSWEQEVSTRIVSRLGLENTWMFTAEDVSRYDDVAAIHYGRSPVRIPLAMTSVRAHGGMVSTAEDGIVFLRAFMGGELFPAGYLAEMMSQWRRIFFPLQYGVGLMKYEMPRMLSIGANTGPFIGHSGSSGSVLFHLPGPDLYISGTVNQLTKRAMVYQLASRLAAIAV